MQSMSFCFGVLPLLTSSPCTCFIIQFVFIIVIVVDAFLFSQKNEDDSMHTQLFNLKESIYDYKCVLKRTCWGGVWTHLMPTKKLCFIV